MAFDPSQFMNKGGTATEEPPSQPLVNQSLPRGFENFMVPQPEPPKTPETWFGEGTAAFGRNIDELQAMGYGAGALTASWLGADSAKKWFMNGYNANISEAEKNPETVKSLGDIQSFDDFTRYSISAIAGFAGGIFAQQFW